MSLTSDKTDNRGIEYTDPSKTTLIKCPDSLSGEVEILQSVKVILGGTNDVNSPFYSCRNTITSLKFAAFSKCESICHFCFSSSSLESADLRQCENLAYLNYSVFSNCTKLSTFYFPPNIKAIKSGCFHKCSALTTINLPDSVEEIDTYANGHYWPLGYTSSTSLNISPNSNLTTLKAECFSNIRCRNIFIPKKVISIGAGILMQSYVETISIDKDNPKYVTDGKSIYCGENNRTLVLLVPTFRGEFVVPSFVQEIYDGCFRTCHITNIVLHDNVTSIGSWAFALTDLTSLQFPENITVVKHDMFRDCLKLLYVNLSNKATSIEYQAFKGSPNIVSIVLPPTLETIGEGAFADCPKLVIDASKNPNINYVDDMMFTNKKKTLSSYFGTDPNKNLVVPEGLTNIGLGTFSGKKLKSISFNGETLTSISNQAFKGCTLESISLPSSLTYIGSECFYNCNNLKSVLFDPDTPLTTIPNNCFENCKLLENIILPSSVTTIQDYAFLGCSKIGDIGLSSTQISAIGIYAFKNSGITSLENSKNVISFGYGSFYESTIETVTFCADTIPSSCFFGCSSLTSINIVSVDTIEESTFENCVSLTSFVIPSSLRIIKSFAFRNCVSLSSVTLSIGSNIDQIYGGAFINCPNLQSIKLDSKDNRYRFSNGALTNYEETKLITFIPSNLIDTYIVPVTMTSIGNYAFMSCPNLVRVLFSGNSIQTIGRESFKNCPKLSFLYITSSSLTSIGEGAFDGSILLRRCGSVRCDKNKRDMFISSGIPTISFNLECSNEISCRLNPSLIFNLLPILITPLIVM